jgi:DNA-binding response OmpR family regulator
MSNIPNILIIDDDEEMAAMLHTLFAARGYRPLVAHSAAEVAALLTRDDVAWPMQVILLDMMMPYVDGSELYDWLRIHPKTTDTPVIVLSAVDSVAKRVEMLQKGADDYLVKPCPIEELYARVAIHAKLHELRHTAQANKAQLVRQTGYWEALAAVGELVHGQFDLEATLLRAVEIISQEWHAHHCTIYLYDQQTNQNRVVAHAPHQTAVPEAHNPFVRRVVLQQTIQRSGELLAVPLLRHRSLLGVVVLQLGEQHRSTALEHALHILGSLLAMSITNHYLFESLQSQKTAVAPSPDKASLQALHTYIQMLLQFHMDDQRRLHYLHRAEEELAKLMA